LQEREREGEKKEKRKAELSILNCPLNTILYNILLLVDGRYAQQRLSLLSISGGFAVGLPYQTH
jgi:hypothetical protein